MLVRSIGTNFWPKVPQTDWRYAFFIFLQIDNRKGNCWWLFTKKLHLNKMKNATIVIDQNSIAVNIFNYHWWVCFDLMTIFKYNGNCVNTASFITGCTLKNWDVCNFNFTYIFYKFLYWSRWLCVRWRLLHKSGCWFWPERPRKNVCLAWYLPIGRNPKYVGYFHCWISRACRFLTRTSFYS